MDFNNITKIITSQFKDSVDVDADKNVLFVNPDNWLEIARFIKNDDSLLFDYLMSISSYDKGDSKVFGVAYNLHSIELKHSLECRIEVEEDTSIPSVVSLWRAADWHEREAYDLMGIKFEHHPNLKRILLPQDWEGHPLRKNYIEPEYYHGMPVAKDKSYWE